MNVGILGAGQLGRMLALAGKPLGLSCCFYDSGPAESLAGLGMYYDAAEQVDALNRFIDSGDVFSYEFETFHAATAERIAQHKPLYPTVSALMQSQDRGQEKALFEELSIPVPPYGIAKTEAELMEIVERLQYPVVVKTTTMGYDGKGQAVVRDLDTARTIWSLFECEVMVERFVPFVRELSQIAVRGRDGDIAFYPLTENYHHEGILRYSVAPAPSVAVELAEQARGHVRRILQHLDYVGTMALEMFETPDGLLANEMAARVHNSGHWTQDGAAVCQFENHLRAIAGWPLGQATQKGHTAMVNIIGRHDDPHGALQIPGTHVHLYDKSERPGRKLGHINVCGDTHEGVIERLQELRRFLPDAAPVLR